MKLSSTLLALASAVLLLSACENTDSASGSAGGSGDGSMGFSGAPGSQDDLAASVGDRVFFDYDSSSLSSEAQATLQKQAEWLGRYPNVNITVEGHCDERGTREYNLALGERRASAAKKYLVSLGVSSGRISTISYGKERPAVVGSDDSSFSQNRRAVTVVTAN